MPNKNLNNSDLPNCAILYKAKKRVLVSFEIQDSL
jgi:hypothetical protein